MIILLITLLTFVVGVCGLLHGTPVVGRKRVAVQLHADAFGGAEWTDVHAESRSLSPESVTRLARDYGYRSLGAVANLPDHFLFEELDEGSVARAAATRAAAAYRKRDSAAATAAAAGGGDGQVDSAVHLHLHPHVLHHEEQVARKLHKRSSAAAESPELPPRDPLFTKQWHLLTSSKYSVRAEGAWSQGVYGKGVQVAVVDDGLQFVHPDITANFDAEGSFDFNDNDDDVTPDGKVRPGGFVDDHGTPAAGLCCAVENGPPEGPHAQSFCGVGAAFQARVAGIRILGADTEDHQEADGVTFNPQRNDIYSNSWGPCDNCALIEGPRTLAKRAIEKNMASGRGGKGSIYVWAAGNGRGRGDNCNNDGWANWRYTLTIAGLTDRGKVAYYSEFCSALHVAVPGGGGGPSLTTTDLLGSKGQSSGDCMSTFSGTSAAAPVAAGVVALVLEAQPGLGWRDVQAVIIRSAVNDVDVDDGDWQTNGANVKYSHKYGFGLLNAAGAVTLAKTWKPWPAELATNSTTSVVDRDVPEGNDPVVSEIKVSGVPDGHVLEHVEIFVNIQHPTRGSLAVNLVSPSGTVSRLHEPHSDSKRNIPAGWRFTSNANWGEQPNGKWTLQVGSARGTGRFVSWTVCLYSHKEVSGEPTL